MGKETEVGVVDYDRVASICEAHGIGLPVDCIEMVVEIIRIAARGGDDSRDAARYRLIRAGFGDLGPEVELHNAFVDGGEKLDAVLDAMLAAAPAAPAQSGAPKEDAISRSKRILALVDTYVERPDRMNRNGLRSHLFDEFTEAAGIAPQPSQPAQAGDEFRKSVESMVAMLEAGEWAEHASTIKAPGDALAARLESAITDLHNGISDVRESAVVLDDERAEDKKTIAKLRSRLASATVRELERHAEQIRREQAAAVLEDEQVAQAFLESMKPRANKIEGGVRLWTGWALVEAVHHGASVSSTQAAMTGAARDVLVERLRQVSAEGWTLEHDDAQKCDEIAAFAALYAMPPGAREWPAEDLGYAETIGEALVPDGWKPKFGDRRRELVKAGALILAEIERIDRAALTSSAAGQPK